MSLLGKAIPSSRTTHRLALAPSDPRALSVEFRLVGFQQPSRGRDKENADSPPGLRAPPGVVLREGEERFSDARVEERRTKHNHKAVEPPLVMGEQERWDNEEM
ncbi:unnamed protein product [Lampetra fluviatilis]